MGQRVQGLQFDIELYSGPLMRNRINFIWRPQIDTIDCCKFPRCYDSNFHDAGKNRTFPAVRGTQGFPIIVTHSVSLAQNLICVNQTEVGRARN